MEALTSNVPQKPRSPYRNRPGENTPAAPIVENAAAEHPPAAPYMENAPHPALLGWCEASLNIYVQDDRVSLLLPRYHLLAQIPSPSPHALPRDSSPFLYLLQVIIVHLQGPTDAPLPAAAPIAAPIASPPSTPVLNT